MTINKVKLIGGKSDGVIFARDKNSEETINSFKMDKSLIYQIGSDIYRPTRIENKCLILKAAKETIDVSTMTVETLH